MNLIKSIQKEISELQQSRLHITDDQEFHEVQSRINQLGVKIEGIKSRERKKNKSEYLEDIQIIK